MAIAQPKTTPSPNQVASDPILFADRLLKIQDKDMQVIPLVYNFFQRDYLKNRTSRDLILKPRQLGFSTLVQAEFRRYEWTRASRTLTLGKDDENTTDLRAMADFYYENLPIDFRPTRTINNATRTVYPLVQSRATIRTAGNRNSGRGGTNTHIHLSEAAFYPDAGSIVASALQAGKPTWVVAESTPNGAQGWFYEECMAALRGESVWKLHFYRWFDNPEYAIPLAPKEEIRLTDEEKQLVALHKLSLEQIKWRRFKQLEVRDKFLQEYPEDVLTCFLQSGGGVFTVSQSQITPYPYTSPYTPEGAKHHNTYVMGIDWGQSDDSTVAVIFDATDYKEVAIYRKRHTSYESMISDIVDLAHFWQVEKIIPEKNSMGTPAIEMLFAEINKREWAKDPRTGYSSEPVIQAFTTTHKSKDDLVKLFIAGLESGLSLLPDEIANHELIAYQTKQTASGLWTYSAPDGGHDDTVIARLLANKASYEMR